MFCVTPKKKTSPYCCSEVFAVTLVAPDLLPAVSGVAALSPDLFSKSSCNSVCVFGNRAQASINNGQAITVVICMHSFTWLHHLTGGSKQCSIQCKVLLESLLPGFEFLVPTFSIPTLCFLSGILITHRCRLEYYLQSCDSLLLLNDAPITSPVSTRQLLQFLCQSWWNGV